jgi:hypothetical protein
MVAVLGPVEALPCHIHTHTYAFAVSTNILYDSFGPRSSRPHTALDGDKWLASRFSYINQTETVPAHFMRLSISKTPWISWPSEKFLHLRRIERFPYVSDWAILIHKNRLIIIVELLSVLSVCFQFPDRTWRSQSCSNSYFVKTLKVISSISRIIQFSGVEN